MGRRRTEKEEHNQNGHSLRKDPWEETIFKLVALMTPGTHNLSIFFLFSTAFFIFYLYGVFFCAQPTRRQNSFLYSTQNIIKDAINKQKQIHHKATT